VRRRVFWKRGDQRAGSHHVGVTVKCLYTSEELAVITQGNEDLDVVADCLLEEGEGTGRLLVLLYTSQSTHVSFQRADSQ
jgi:hypothetical protein